jgi:glycine/D-amino acid oxidase-like deaminating enzyme/nitrite reductase/ring-hydroxylating ferredoxin subunit
MNSDSGKTVSPWFASIEMPNPGELDRDITTDVCVIGGGIAGLTTAYLLGREGRKVVLIDDGPLGGGETGRTTAHISNALDDRYYSLERMHGGKGARLAAESHTAAIRKIEQITNEAGIECDFHRLDGYLFEPPGGDVKNIEREFHAATRAGLEVDLMPYAPAPFDTGRALRFRRQAQFHPLKYLSGLVREIQKQGGVLFTNTQAADIQGGSPGTIQTSTKRKITANSIVVATNTPVNDRVFIHTKQAPYRTYVVGFQIPPNSVPEILLWDNDSPYHYIRTQQLQAGPLSETILIVGGEDHKTGQDDEASVPFGHLEKWTRDRYPMAGEIRFRWSGQVMEPVDGVAYIGRNPGHDENVYIITGDSYIITGDSGNGITHGTIGGMLITDLIMGRENPWATLYDPSRRTYSLTSLKEFARENLDVAAQYGSYVAKGEVSSVEDIRPGHGAIIRRGTKLIAASRDESGELCEHSAVCPHLGCIVRWNDVEKTWDCPCHGSRFDQKGKVVNGPSLGNLEPAE